MVNEGRRTQAADAPLGAEAQRRTARADFLVSRGMTAGQGMKVEARRCLRRRRRHVCQGDERPGGMAFDGERRRTWQGCSALRLQPGRQTVHLTRSRRGEYGSQPQDGMDEDKGGVFWKCPTQSGGRCGPHPGARRSAIQRCLNRT